ncbi:MAG: lysophospholipid acyltransferase family protein [Ignavibacteriae bacterium]|nr:lysophospholipid acyltransferase family protein [Ignavibacteriota bacterium]
MTSYIEYLGFRALAVLVSHAPYRWVGAMGSLLGLAVMYVTGYRRTVTMDNLRHAFPGKPQEELDAIARGAYRNYGRAILEMLWAGGQSADVLRARIHPRNIEVLREALAGGHGTILMSAHFGSWEFLLTGLKLHIPEPFVAIAQRQRNERIDAMIDERRRRFGVMTVPMGPSVREVLRALGEGKVIIILGDQSGPRESVFIPFFGRPSATHRGAAAFALRAHAPIVLVLLMRREDGEYDAVFERIDTTGLTGDREAQIVELTARHAAVLERHIRERPDHWLWMHKRWKHTPEYEARMTASAVHAELP